MPSKIGTSVKTYLNIAALANTAFALKGTRETSVKCSFIPCKLRLLVPSRVFDRCRLVLPALANFAIVPRRFCGIVSVLYLMIFFSGCGTNEKAAPTNTASAVCDTTGNDVLYTALARPSGLPAVGYTADGPGPRRVLLATSSDGISFTRLRSVVSDQANTPNMLILASGRILLYYTAYDIDPVAASNDGNNQDGIAVAVSDDSGTSWKHYCVGMSGFGGHPPIGDPDIMQLADGSFRMYVTNGDANGNISIFSATSSDGLHFTKEGTALNTGSTNYKDSLTAYVGSQYVMYVLRSADGFMKQATSANGTTFSSVSDSNYTITVNTIAESFVLSNWLNSGGGTYRVYAFSGATKDIRSFTTANGTSLTADATVSLGLPLDSTYEKSWVKDAAVVKLPNGSYLMAYVAETP